MKQKDPSFLDKTIAFISPEWGLKRKFHSDRLEFAYDAARQTRAHASAGHSLSTAASESLANQRDRVKMMWEARNLVQNYSFFKSVLLKESMYVCGSIRYQANTGEPAIDQAYEEYFNEWQTKCDITGRSPFRHLIQLGHMGMRRDGDAGWVMVTQGKEIRLQAIESDRIGNPNELGKKQENYIGGITINDLGQPTSYKIFKRTLHGQYKDPHDVPAPNFVHYFDPLRTDQYRGITAFETAIPHAKDLYELLKMEKLAVKWGSAHAGVITKNDQGPDKWTSKVPVDATGKAAGDLKLEKMEAGKILRLQPGDQVNMFPTNSRPSATFNGFITTLVREMANGLNLPYAFVWDMSAFGGATARLEVQQAQRAFQRHQQLLKDQVLNRVKDAVLGRAIAFRDLPAHANYKKGRWQFNSQITADLGHEVQANINLQQAGLKTSESIYGEMGLDFQEESEKIAKELSHLQELAKKYGIPVSILAQRLQGADEAIMQYRQMLEQQEQEQQQIEQQSVQQTQ
jgi:lambda family phage portal protein